MTSFGDFTAVKTRRAYEHIVTQIEMAIASGSLQAGQHLPSEREMMEEFKVSRPTVREALRVLESMGLIRSKHGDPNGPEILPPSDDLLYRPMSQLVRINQLSFDEFVPIRISIDSLACSLAAETRSDADLLALEKAITGMRASVESESSSEEFAQADINFHTAIWKASDNLLISMFGNVTRGLMGDLIKDRIEDSSDARAVMRLSLEHDTEIFNAIRDQDSELASYLARRYIAEYYGEYVSASKRKSVLNLVGQPHTTNSPSDA